MMEGASGIVPEEPGPRNRNLSPRRKEQTMITPKRHPLLRFAPVPVAVAAAVLLRSALWPVIGAGLPFLLLWPAVMCCAWYGGFGPGLLATVLSALAEAFFVLEPRYSLSIEKQSEAVGVAMFVLLGAVMSLLTEMLQRAYFATEEANRQKDVFLATL